MSAEAGRFEPGFPQERKLILPVFEGQGGIFYEGLRIMGGYMLSGFEFDEAAHERRLERMRNRLIDATSIVHGDRDTKVFTGNGLVEFGASVRQQVIGLDLETAEPVYKDVLTPEITFDLEEPVPLRLVVGEAAGWVALEASVRSYDRRPDAFALAVAAQSLEPFAA